MSTTTVVFFIIHIMVATIEKLKKEQWFNPAEELDDLAHENIVNHLDYTEEVVDNTLVFEEETSDYLAQSYESIHAITS